MNTQMYTIFAMLVRYVLLVIVFIGIIQAIKESRKDNIYRGFTEIATLLIVDTREKFALEQDNTIGKAKRNDIVIKHRSVGQSHARLYFETDEWIIEPFRRKKVFVNMYQVTDKYIIKNNDEIVFGDMVCVFNQHELLLEEGEIEED